MNILCNRVHRGLNVLAIRMWSVSLSHSRTVFPNVCVCAMDYQTAKNMQNSADIPLIPRTHARTHTYTCIRITHRFYHYA